MQHHSFMCMLEFTLFSLFHMQIVHSPYTQKSNVVELRASWDNCVTGSQVILLVLLKKKNRRCWVTEIWEWYSYLIKTSMSKLAVYRIPRQ